MVETPRGGTPTAPARPPLPEHVTTPLLALITERSLDADYEHVAARKRSRGESSSGRGVPSRTASLVLVAFGLLVTIAALQTSRNASVDEASRASLIDQISQRRHSVADLQRQLSNAQARRLELQRAVTRLDTQTQATQARLTRVQSRAGFAPVHGPGIQATVNSAPGSTTADLVRDSDLALLADALWAAGAEAISVNGERLTVLSAFRNVGIAILVNSRPVNPPYVFDVIGDPDTLPANLLSSPVGGRWYALKNSLGFSFEVHDAGSLTLPAAEPPRLRSVRSAASDDRDARTQGDDAS
jgi:uncharacterized protein YlxW (UPF0749 family)